MTTRLAIVGMGKMGRAIEHLAPERGCEVVHFEWDDNFAHARQASFDALPDWLDFSLWADADEVKRLKKLLAQSRRGMQGYTEDLTTPKPRPKNPKRR